MARNYRCPKCKSENIRRYQDVYIEGVATHSSEHNFVGVSGSGVFTGVGSSHGTSITNMAKTVAPPRPKPYKFSNFLACFVASIWLISIGAHDIWKYGIDSYEPKTLIIFCIPVIIVILLTFVSIRHCIQVYKWNNREFNQSVDRWHNSFVCLRCGHRFYYNDL